MDRRTPLARAAALCSAGAAAIHFGVTPAHFGSWWAAGVFVLACACAQIAWAVLAWTRPSPRLLVVGACGNACIALVWLLSRVVGLPFGPAGTLPVGRTDVVCTALETAVVVLAVLLVVRQPRRSPGRFSTAVTAVVGGVVLLTSGVALAVSPSPDADEPGRQATRRAHDKGNLPDLSHATRTDTRNASRLLTDSIAYTKTYRDSRRAEADGYDVGAVMKRWQRHHQGADDAAPIRVLHVPRPAARTDGKVVDPKAPEELVYRRGHDGKLLLVGVRYVVTAADGEPPAVAGPYTRWRTHRVCVDGSGRPVEGAGRGECPGGGRRTEQVARMHVWFVKSVHLRRAYARKPPVRAILTYQRTLR